VGVSYERGTPAERRAEKGKSERTQPLLRYMEATIPGFRDVFKAHRILYHSTLGLRVQKKKKRFRDEGSGLRV